MKSAEYTLVYFFSLVTLGTIFGGMMVWSWAQDFDEEALQQMPVTPIAGLSAGTEAKIVGVIASNRTVVLDVDSEQEPVKWTAYPFGVRDATGVVAVDVKLVNGSTGYDRIASGRHASDWWSGDNVSIIGEVTLGPSGVMSMVASFVARGPDWFHFSIWDFFLIPMAGTWVMATGPGLIYYWRGSVHRRNLPDFTARQTGWWTCPACQAEHGPKMKKCPGCGSLPAAQIEKQKLAGTRPAAPLPVLNLRSHFRYYLSWERHTVLLLGVVLPGVTIPMGLWAGPVSGSGWDWFHYPLVVGIILGAGMGLGYFVPERVTLSPELIRFRAVLPATVIPAKNVVRILTLSQRGSADGPPNPLGRTSKFIERTLKQEIKLHIVVGRDGRKIGFGKPFSPEDFRTAQEWLARFAAEARIPHVVTADFFDAIVEEHRD